MKYKSTNIREIISDIKEHPLLASLSEEHIIRKTGEFFGILGLEELYQQKIAVVEISNYRGVLPDDFIEITGVRSYPKRLLDLDKEEMSDEDRKVKRDGIVRTYKPVYYKSITETFYNDDKRYHFSTPSYKIQGNVIYTSTKDAPIEIAYKAVEVDDCGYPLIPDNEKFKRAFKAYIKFERFTTLFDLEQININVFNNAEQDYCFAVAACENEFKMPSYDEAESMINQASHRLIRDRHSVGFADAGEKDYYWIH